MSAWRVTQTHINAILHLIPARDASYYWKGQRYPFSGDQERIGQVLLDENYRSVDHRYDEDTAVPHFIWRPFMRRTWTTLELVKALHSYEYQTCECPDWDETEAHSIVQTLERDSWDRLPEYEAADTWSINDDPDDDPASDPICLTPILAALGC